MQSIKIDSISQIITEVATTEIVPRFRKLQAGDVQMKGKDDPVTIADQESERRLTERFMDYLPGSVVVGEEAVSKDKVVLAHLAGEKDIWIIDPIDGTRNFVAGNPEFAVMVALVRQGQPIASWIHAPVSGDTIMAEEGAGVWLHGKRLHLTANKTNPVGLVGSRVKKLIADPSVMPEGAGIAKIEIGSCAGFDYPRLFEGETIFANATTPRVNFLFYRHTNPWDHIPGLFLHREGGGYSADWSGKPYEMTNPRAGLLFAHDRETWIRLHYLFRPLMAHVLKNDVWEF